MKVYFSSGIHSGLDATRGIGANTSEMVKALDKIEGITIVNNPQEADIIHYTKFNPFFVNIPFLKPKGQKWILTIHDLIQLVYPKNYPAGIKGSIKFLINKFLLKKNVDRILTISETSKKDIVRFLSIDPNMVDVSYLGPKDAHHPLSGRSWVKEIKDRYKLPDKFVFYLGDVNYNKNIPTLVRACEKAKIKLVIVGKQAKEIKENTNGFDVYLGPLDYLRALLGRPHPEIAHYKMLSKYFKKNDVYCLGFASDEDANKLMNLAVCTVQPSFYEGFGLSVIHGFASGCPVICSRTQTLVEIAGDACLYFDANSSDDLAKKIKLLLNDNKLKDEYIKKGFAHVKKYSWSKNAKETYAIYKDLNK